MHEVMHINLISVEVSVEKSFSLENEKSFCGAGNGDEEKTILKHIEMTFKIFNKKKLWLTQKKKLNDSHFDSIKFQNI